MTGRGSEAQPGDLVRRRWVTRAQKERWTKLKGDQAGEDPDSTGLVLDTIVNEANGARWALVLWASGQETAWNMSHLTVVSKGQQ